MKKLALLLFVALLPLQAQARELAKPQIIALYFYADWCNNCMVLSPKINDARGKGELDKKPILFVTMNFTDKTTINQSVMLAQALGLGDYVKQQGSATGYVVLLDANSKKELARFDRETSADTFLKAVNDHLKGA